MHNKTVQILYGQNEFCIYVDFSRFKPFLCLIGKNNAAPMGEDLIWQFWITIWLAR
jgi:hypothetical protein